MCGLGGDAFWLIWPGSDTPSLHALNGSGRSAALATISAVRDAGYERMPVRGPWTVTVPGAIRSWGDAHARFGRLPWPDLIAPAIDLAADGFAASDGWIAAVERAARIYGTDGDWARVFRPARRAWRPGERVRPGALGGALRRLASEGPAEAYEGGLGRRAATYLASRGAPLTAEDFAAHRSDWVEPIATDYRGTTATSHPPNSSGVIALELLNVMASFTPPPPAAFRGGQGLADPEWIHRSLEAGRVTLAERDAELTDPDAMARGALDRLLDPDRARELAARIGPSVARPARPLGTPAGGGTVYLAAADRWGGVVSLIESNYAGFGSGLVDPETGIAYQNRGAFFSLDERHPNALAPRKRTMHTLAPGMLLRDGRPWIVHGSMGGELQPQVFAQFVSNVVDGGLDVARAVTAPRWAADVEEHYGPPLVSRLESRLPATTVRELERRGHRVGIVDAFASGMGHQHAIEIVREGGEVVAFAAATDPRSEGSPACW